ncbi:MAG: T9SS type A sorting domain-containing protein [Flavobacteriales bacterium]|nr:T9SS type A sorting domain-containing protein [Flavobacteriales bacterium]MCB9174415.1 T9SS type A sorting domain-containing protein [Flavobacteriales bacterium]
MLLIKKINTRAIYFVVLMFHFLTTSSQNIFEIDKISLEEAKHHQKLFNSTQKGVVETENYNLYYHRLVWEINPEILYIKGEITSYFSPVATNFNQIYFDLTTALTVDSVIYHDTLVSFTQLPNNSLQINLPYEIGINSLDSITVYYQGVPQNSGFGSFVQSSHLNDSIIWTLSEPFGAYEWWPCKNGLYDKIDSIDVIVTTPKKYRVGSQGLLINEVEIGANKTYHWKHRYPISTYLISIAVTNYASFTINANLSQGVLPIVNYIYPEDSITYFPQINAITPIIELFDSLFGVYPFMNEKYGHAQFGWGGGMEHQTMSSMGGFSEHLMSHELGHQWFGDKVTCGSWSDIWLNEGFATYCTGMFYKHLSPVWFKPWKEDMINSATSLPDGSVYNPDTTSVSRIFSSRLSYKKAAFLVRMLEWKVGSQLFYQAINNYLSDVNLAYHFATTENLKNHLETLSGLDLTEFFNDWYYGEGFPSYQITWAQNGTDVFFKVNQTQSHNSVAFFDIPIPIYLKGQGLDTTVVFDHTFSGQHFTISIPFTIDSVFFDPELWILSKNNIVTYDINTSFSHEFLDSQVDIYPNPTNNILSISSLKPITKVIVYDALGKQIKQLVIGEGDIKLDVNTTNFPKGIYFIEIQVEKEIIRKKVSKI